MTTPVWISLGGNVGDRRAILAAALDLLDRTDGVAVTRVSSFRETLPVGGPLGQGPFLNAAARLDTTLTPRELLGAMQRIENQLGRVRVVRWGERTLDLDILIYGSESIDEPDLKLPHPRLAVRRFVLEPLAEITPPALKVLKQWTVPDLLANLDRRPRIVMIGEMMKAAMPGLADQLGSQLAGIVLSDLIPRNQILEPVTPQAPLGSAVRDSSIESLRSLHRGMEQRFQSTASWIICDDMLDFAGLRKLHEVHPDGSAGRPTTHQANQYAQLDELLGVIPNPTVVIEQPSRFADQRYDDLLSPIYWPEATDPDAIAAEVVAVCRGIMSV